MTSVVRGHRTGGVERGRCDGRLGGRLLACDQGEGDRQGKSDEQQARGGEVPTHSLRLGEIVGEHAWTIVDAEETLMVTHRAHSRRAFRRGVLPAVRFVAGREPGLYGLTDVLAALAEGGS